MDKLLGAKVNDLADTKSDGRMRRSHKSRQKIIDASLALVHEGEMSVSAQKVAQRAGVGLRSVFRHFSDMEGLFVEFNEQLTRDNQHYFLPDEAAVNQPLANRVDNFISRRHHGFSQLKNYIYFTQNLYFEHAILRRQFTELVTNLDRLAVQFLPEIKALSEVQHNHALALASFQYWDLQCRLRGQSVVQTQAHVTQLLRDIFERQMR